MIAGLAVGRIVHYVLENGQHRPAIVVRDWQQENGLVNLQVFTDGWNDQYASTHLVQVGEQKLEGVLKVDQNSIWRTSVHCSEEMEPGTWHWPEKV